MYSYTCGLCVHVQIWAFDKGTEHLNFTTIFPNMVVATVVPFTLATSFVLDLCVYCPLKHDLVSKQPSTYLSILPSFVYMFSVT